jgi:hypothetical protein
MNASVSNITHRSSFEKSSYAEFLSAINGAYCRCRSVLLERVMGIEPTLFAWEAKVLPLNYTRFF